jgi:hypothetical protein
MIGDALGGSPERTNIHVGTESIRETINAAFREVIRISAVRDLAALGETGAFDFLPEPGAEERMWR